MDAFLYGLWGTFPDCITSHHGCWSHQISFLKKLSTPIESLPISKKSSRSGRCLVSHASKVNNTFCRRVRFCSYIYQRSFLHTKGPRYSVSVKIDSVYHAYTRHKTCPENTLLYQWWKRQTPAFTALLTIRKTTEVLSAKYSYQK